MSDQEKTKEMKKYEEETGKFAIWRGTVTEGFKKWQKGEKIYSQDKERISILVSDEIKEKWQKFADENNYTAVSKLVRKGVDFFIDFQPKILYLLNFSKIAHNLKEPLTSIKGFSQILMEQYKDELSWDVLSKIKKIFDQSLILEEKILDISGITDMESIQTEAYDILIVDDDNSTIDLLFELFNKKGFNCRFAKNGSEALELLRIGIPKIVLLDIILPDINGYDVCKLIKTNKKFKDLKIFYITAVHKSEVVGKLKDTGADGYFLKPFNMEEFDILMDDL